MEVKELSELKDYIKCFVASRMFSNKLPISIGQPALDEIICCMHIVVRPKFIINSRNARIMDSVEALMQRGSTHAKERLRGSSVEIQ